MVNRAGNERTHEYASETELKTGDVLRPEGRDWFDDRIEDGDPPRVLGKPARYRLRLHHPHGREELGAFRRYRPDAPRLGHSLTTTEEGQRPRKSRRRHARRASGRSDGMEFVETFDASSEALVALDQHRRSAGEPPWEYASELLADGLIDVHFELTRRGRRALPRR